MKVRRTDRFKRDYQKLGFLLRDPRHPSLRIHKLRSVEGLWEFRVTMSYRVIFELEGEHYVLLGVGPHGIVDRT